MVENGNGGIPATMLVSPNGYMGNNGFGGFGGDGWWILILFFLLAGNGGWGMNGANGMNGLYPWLNNSNQINDGFRDSIMNDTLTSIRDGVFGLSTQMCNGFSNAEIAANGRQMADMQQNFALQSQLANCCCENRLGIADLKYTVATENCADRAAVSDGIRDVISAQSANTQKILDKLCQLELDGYKRENDNLRSQLSDAKISASQTAQNAFIAQGLSNEVDALYNRLSSCPVPTTPVYGRTPIFTCGGNTVGCGCGGVA
jgi:hypothetical protein